MKPTIDKNKLTYPVTEVFTNYLAQDGYTYYNIPDYQRGYKWTTKNVEELLDDIKTFSNSLDTHVDRDKFYCLQNITICTSKDIEGNKIYNVVDGQQRLTTLTVLLSYLGKSDLVKNKIKYSIREATHRFITEQIITRQIWQSTPEIKHKDQYYLYAVAQKIQEWFHPKDAQGNRFARFSDEEHNKYVDIILNRVHLIVNQLQADEEQIFANLNGAKVNLDGADLLRAVMMTHSAKEKFGNHASQTQINEFRVRMGLEIDEMSRWWGQKDVISFFGQMIPSGTAKEAKLHEFDTKAFPINILYILLYEINKNAESIFSFNFFEYGLDKDENRGNDNWELYIELRKLHLEMQDWFGDKHIYHYLGYLFFRHKHRTQFSDIYASWKKADSKQGFKTMLKDKIVSCITYKYQNNDKDDNQLSKEELCNAIYKNMINTRNDWYHNDNELFDCLILQDIITTIKNESKSLGYLPVDYFTRNEEDKEHIGCQTPNENDRKNKDKWIACINAIKGQYPEIDEKAAETMSKMLINDSVSDEQQEKLIKGLNKYGLNSIGNMALLDLHVNRSYGNSSFSNKRLEIIKNYYQGRFIRHHTLKVFIKAGCNDPDNLERWTFEDIRRNAEHIAKTLITWALTTEEMPKQEMNKISELIKSWSNQ